MAVSYAVKILDIVGKLVENDSFELRKTAAAETLFELLEPSVKFFGDLGSLHSGFY